MRIVKIAERKPGNRPSRRTQTVLAALTLSFAAALGGCGSTPTTASCTPDPVAIVTVAPSYHPKASDAGVEAYAVFEFTITMDGDVTAIETIDSGTQPPTPAVEKAFSKAARKSMALWRFNRRGTPCQSRHRIDYPG